MASAATGNDGDAIEEDKSTNSILGQIIRENHLEELFQPEPTQQQQQQQIEEGELENGVNLVSNQTMCTGATQFLTLFRTMQRILPVKHCKLHEND